MNAKTTFLAVILALVMIFDGAFIVRAGPFDDENVVIENAAVEAPAAAEEHGQTSVWGKMQPDEVGACVGARVGPAYARVCKAPGEPAVYEYGARVGPVGMAKNSQGDVVRSYGYFGVPVGPVTLGINGAEVTNSQTGSADVQVRVTLGVGLGNIANISIGGYAQKSVLESGSSETMTNSGK